jgi:hypothetical protein
LGLGGVYGDAVEFIKDYLEQKGYVEQEEP